jgi:hypothetical protein
MVYHWDRGNVPCSGYTQERRKAVLVTKGKEKKKVTKMEKNETECGPGKKERGVEESSSLSAGSFSISACELKKSSGFVVVGSMGRNNGSLSRLRLSRRNEWKRATATVFEFLSCQPFCTFIPCNENIAVQKAQL